MTLFTSVACLRRMAKPKTVRLTLDQRLAGDPLPPDTDLAHFAEPPTDDRFL